MSRRCPPPSDAHGCSRTDRPAEPVEQQLPQDAGRGGEDGHEGLPGITSAVQDVVANNAAIISRPWTYSAVTENERQRTDKASEEVSGKAEGAGGGTVRHPSDHLPYTDNQTEFGTCNKIGIRTKEEYHEIAFNFFLFYRNVAALRDGGSPVGGHRPRQYGTGNHQCRQYGQYGEADGGTGEQAPDRPGLCPEGVRHRQTRTDVHGLIDRQNRLNSNCLRTLEEAEKMDMKELPGITSAVQDVVANNAAIISRPGIYSAVTENERQRTDGAARRMSSEVRRREASLGTIRQIMSHTRTIRRNLGLVTE